MQLATTISTRETAGAHGSMLLWAALVGLSFPAVSRLGEGLPPLTLTALRFVVAALVLAPGRRGRPARDGAADAPATRPPR